MGRKLQDHTDERHGRLRVKADARMRHPSTGERLWLCWCDCGGGIITTHTALKKDTKSCGCLRKEVATRTILRFRFEKFVSASERSQRSPIEVFGLQGPIRASQKQARRAFAAFQHRLSDEEINRLQAALLLTELSGDREEFDRAWAPIAQRLEAVNLG